MLFQPIHPVTGQLAATPAPAPRLSTLLLLVGEVSMLIFFRLKIVNAACNYRNTIVTEMIMRVIVVVSGKITK